MTHRRRPLLLSALVGIALLGTTVAASPPVSATVRAAPTDLGAQLDAILNNPRLADSQVGVTVRNQATGEVLYSRDANRRMIPASNNKALTSAAALDVLGADYRFTTSVAADGSQRGKVLYGSLYLKGTGDPTTLARDYDDLAAKVATAGITVVTGGLVADDTAFDGVRLGTEWGWDDQPYYYMPQISALTVASDTDYNPGTVIVEVRPGAAGQPAQLKVVPETRYVTLVNRATTGAAGSGTDISIERQHGTNDIVVSGSIAAGGGAYQDYSTVWEPTGYAAAVFRDALARHGVRIAGPTSTGATPPAARALAERQSMTLRELLIPFMKLSNNGHSEALTKAMGRKVSGRGTWQAGVQATAQSLARLGLDTAGIQRVDGSGLSRQDLVSPTQLTNLYRGVAGQPWFSTWYDALPIAGVPDRLVGGTLRNRMRNTPAANNLRGKTGSLTSVSALSGYVTDADGTRLVFSIMLNNQLVFVKDIEDAVAVTLASYSANGTSARARLAPPPPAVPSHVDPRLATHECTWIKAC